MKPLEEVIAASAEPGYVALDALAEAGYIIVSSHVEDGKNQYLKELLEAGAVDDIKMKFRSYYPLKEVLALWGIIPRG